MENTSTALAITKENPFVFDVNSTFKPRTTAKCHNTVALKMDYKVFSKEVSKIVKYVSLLDIKKSLSEDEKANIRKFIEHTENFVEIISTSLNGILDSNREEIEEEIKQKVKSSKKDNKKDIFDAINLDDIFVEAICNSFNNVIEKINESLNVMDDSLDEDDENSIYSINNEIKTIASLSLGYHSLLYNLVAAMSKYKMNYKDGKLIICCTGSKNDVKQFENV